MNTNKYKKVSFNKKNNKIIFYDKSKTLPLSIDKESKKINNNFHSKSKKLIENKSKKKVKNNKSKYKKLKFTSYKNKKLRKYRSKKKNNLKKYLVKTNIINEKTKSPEKLVDDLFQICYNNNINVIKYPQFKYNKD